MDELPHLILLGWYCGRGSKGSRCNWDGNGFCSSWCSFERTKQSARSYVCGVTHARTHKYNHKHTHRHTLSTHEVHTHKLSTHSHTPCPHAKHTLTHVHTYRCHDAEDGWLRSHSTHQGEARATTHSYYRGHVLCAER